MEIEERHIEKARAIARIVYHTYNLDGLSITYDDLFSEALLYLQIASTNWLGESNFEIHIWFSMQRGINKYISKERNRQRIAYFFSYDIQLDSDDGQPRSFLDMLADPIDLEELVETRMLIYSITEALRQEPEVVQETVMRLATDAELSRKHRLTDQNSIKQYRKRFFRDFLKAYESGQPYKSTGRRRKPNVQPSAAPDQEWTPP